MSHPPQGARVCEIALLVEALGSVLGFLFVGVFFLVAGSSNSLLIFFVGCVATGVIIVERRNVDENAWHPLSPDIQHVHWLQASQFITFLSPLLVPTFCVPKGPNLAQSTNSDVKR